MIELIENSNEKIINFFNNQQIGDESLADKLAQLMPSIYIMVATLGSLFVIFIILTFFFYKPINKMVQRRKKFIQSNIDESIKVKQNAYDLETEARAKLQESKQLGNDLIAKAKHEAEIIKEQYIAQGKLEVERLLREAKDDIKSRKKSLEQDSYNEIVSVAITISEQIIKDKITEQETKKYLDDYLVGRNDI